MLHNKATKALRGHLCRANQVPYIRAVPFTPSSLLLNCYVSPPVSQAIDCIRTTIVMSVTLGAHEPKGLVGDLHKFDTQRCY